MADSLGPMSSSKEGTCSVEAGQSMESARVKQFVNAHDSTELDDNMTYKVLESNRKSIDSIKHDDDIKIAGNVMTRPVRTTVKDSTR